MISDAYSNYFYNNIFYEKRFTYKISSLYSSTYHSHPPLIPKPPIILKSPPPPQSTIPPKKPHNPPPTRRPHKKTPTPATQNPHPTNHQNIKFIIFLISKNPQKKEILKIKIFFIKMMFPIKFLNTLTLVGVTQQAFKERI